jgi:hypothetical protein
MRALIAAASVLIVGGGCVGGPPREKPAFEPPALPMSSEESSDSDSAPGVVGAWSSVAFRGPGSASFRRIDLILHGDGGYVSVGEGEGGAKADLGRYTWADRILTVVRPDGTTLRFECRREGPLLLLRDGGSELRLAPIRP